MAARRAGYDPNVWSWSATPVWARAGALACLLVGVWIGNAVAPAISPVGELETWALEDSPDGLAEVYWQLLNDPLPEGDTETGQEEP